MRDVVEDLIFILPLAAVESGNVFITGAANLFFVRYLIDRATHSNFSSVNFLSAHFHPAFDSSYFQFIEHIGIHSKEAHVSPP